MSRTLKDKKSIYRNSDEKEYSSRPEPGLKNRYLNFRKSGPPLDTEECSECGGFMEFEDGYLTCCECGWTENAVPACEMVEFVA